MCLCIFLSLGSSIFNVKIITRKQIGRFIKKTECQEKLWSKKPPTRGPKAAPPVPTADHIPKAIARSLWLSNVILNAASVAGKIIAAPRARSARDAISIIALVEINAKYEAVAKITVPVKANFFTPYLSPSTPIGKRKHAITNEYMSIIHKISFDDVFRSIDSEGAATCKIVASIDTGRYIKIITQRTNHFFLEWCDVNI